MTKGPEPVDALLRAVAGCPVPTAADIHKSYQNLIQIRYSAAPILSVDLEGSPELLVNEELVAGQVALMRAIQPCVGPDSSEAPSQGEGERDVETI